jgi:hypothetical protein
MAASGALLDPDTESAVVGPVWIAADLAGKPLVASNLSPRPGCISRATGGDQARWRGGQWLTRCSARSMEPIPSGGDVVDGQPVDAADMTAASTVAAESGARAGIDDWTRLEPYVEITIGSVLPPVRFARLLAQAHSHLGRMTAPVSGRGATRVAAWSSAQARPRPRG